MAKQVKYATDTFVSDNDKFTGFDADSNNKTKNYSASSIAEYVKGKIESTQITISGQKFILQKHPSNTVNLTTLEENDVILGFAPTGDYIMAKYLGGDETDFFNDTIYNIFNGI